MEWPRWVPFAYAAGVTVLSVGAAAAHSDVAHWVLASLVVLVVWADCTFRPARLGLVDKIVLIGGCTALAVRGDSLVLFAVVITCGEMAIDCPLGHAVGLLGVAVAALFIRAVTASHQTLGDYLPWALADAGTFAGALWVGAQHRLACELRANQGLVAAEAAADERRRLAREIHDVIAHSMTVTMLHVTGARLALTDDPPDVSEAVDALEEAERQGRQSLADIRRTVGLLTEDESQLEAPEPSATDLPELVRSFVEAGQDVRCRVDGDLGTLPPTTGLTVYRVVQESLANAARHAPGALVDVDVRICAGFLGRIGNGRVDVRVTNGSAALPPGAGVPCGGRGVTGMRDRVNAVGGRLEAGPDSDGWRVCARMPLSPA